jgi:F0F1-type ATP synthase assembly protein I
MFNTIVSIGVGLMAGYMSDNVFIGILVFIIVGFIMMIGSATRFITKEVSKTIVLDESNRVNVPNVFL